MLTGVCVNRHPLLHGHVREGMDLTRGRAGLEVILDFEAERRRRLDEDR